MSDLKERLAINIAGFANLIGKGLKGALVVGDGDQTTYLTTEGAATGDALVIDPSAPEGLSWAAVSGGSLVFSDGVTKSGSSVTNDLVTGVTVSQLDVNSSGNASIIAGSGVFSINGVSSNVRINSVGELRFDTTGNDINVIATTGTTNGDINIQASTTTGTLDLNAAATILRGQVSVDITAANNKHITLTTGGTGNAVFNVAHDENHTVGRNFQLVASGSGGIILQADTDNADVKIIAGGAPGEAGTGSVDITGQDVILGPCITFNGPNSYIAADGSVGDFFISGGAGATQSMISITGTLGTINIDGPGGVGLNSAAAILISGGTKVTIQDAAGDTLAFYGAAGATQHAAIADAAGGATVDSQARTAINTLLAAVRSLGLIAT